MDKKIERVVKSREHTKEEKREQKKRRWKRKRERKASQRNVEKVNEDNEGPTNANIDKEECSTPKMLSPSTESRGALMVRLAKKRKIVERAIEPSNSQTYLREVSKTPTLNAGLKEINPEFLECCPTPIGSGSYGDCYFGKYRGGIEVVVKRARTRDKHSDNKRVIKEMVHEGQIISALGDHEGLPLLYGMITKTQPMALVLQFHGNNKKALTLYKAAEEKLLLQCQCLHIFNKICTTMTYVHSKGFLHNDIKSNNVVLEERDNEHGYSPIVIDFGKSKMISSYSEKTLIPRGRQKHYLAPEVVLSGKESTASDVFSLGYMLKCISLQLGFNNVARSLIVKACKENPSERTTLDEFQK